MSGAGDPPTRRQRLRSFGADTLQIFQTLRPRRVRTVRSAGVAASDFVRSLPIFRRDSSTDDWPGRLAFSRCSSAMQVRSNRTLL